MNTTALKSEERVVRDIMTRGVATIQCDEMLPKAAEIMTEDDIMTPFVVEANPEMSLKEIANIMISKGIHRTVVLSPVGRKPVGLLSATDIVKNITQH